MSSSIYTRGGDGGLTSLVDGSRVSKDSRRVTCYGTIDEANSWVGLARSGVSDPLLDRVLDFLQHRLFNCSSNLATPPNAGFAPPLVAEADIELLERAIDRFEETTGPLSHFVLPGGSPTAASLHVARTVCRRAERYLVTMAGDEPVDPLVQKFVNRASDLLFAAARYANAIEERGDPGWDQKLPIPKL